MTEIAIAEAVRAAGTNAVEATKAIEVAAAGRTAPDDAAVQAFEQAMAPDGASPVPFATQVSEVWHGAQGAYQEHLHRMTALSDMSRLGQVSVAQLSELQYEVASLSFQQEIVTNIAKKASDAVSTLVKNG